MHWRPPFPLSYAEVQERLTAPLFINYVKPRNRHMIHLIAQFQFLFHFLIANCQFLDNWQL